MVDVATQLGKGNHELHKQEANMRQLEQAREPTFAHG
jgi:hypothetical protein